MNIKQVKISAIMMGLGVILGAFGAHSLKAVLTADQLGSWKTAVLYLFIHAMGMLTLSVCPIATSDRQVAKVSFYLFLVGILCFSTSIFLLTLQDTLGVGLGFLGPITPVGGLLFVLGWLNLLRLTSLPADH